MTTEQALRKSEAEFRELSQEYHTLLDAIHNSIFLLSPDLKILWANRGASDNLNVVEIEIPPLRERRDDIPLLSCYPHPLPEKQPVCDD